MRWMLLVLVTVGVTVPLDLLGVPSAALFAALLVGVVLAVTRLAPAAVPRPAGLAAQGVLGVYIGTMVHGDALGALGPHWPVVVGVGIATLLLSIAAGALLGLHRDVNALTGALALVAGGASGLVAIARELGGDATRRHPRLPRRPVVRLRHRRARKSLGSLVSEPVNDRSGDDVRLAGRTVRPTARCRAAGADGVDHRTRTWWGVIRSHRRRPAGSGVVHADRLAGRGGLHRESLHAIERLLPAALGLIVLLNLATAGLGVGLAKLTGVSMLDGYLATSPGGIYAVLATAVETGSDITFIIAAQVLRVLLMLFAAPMLARGFVRLTQSRARTAPSSEPIAVADARPAASTSV